jgi:Ca-activated chloride channel homolog
MSFAYPDFLWLLLILPVLLAVDRYAIIRRRRSITAIGLPSAVAQQQIRPVRYAFWFGLASFLGWIMLLLGTAGPRWGKSDEQGVAVGRDVVVVVDLSRSMLADDMASETAKTRWEAAKVGLRDVMDAVARRGGHRLAIIVFAARPVLLCPLTTDYDHIRAKVEEIDGRFPPPGCRPGSDPSITSGTRIGSALIAAIEAHDPRFTGSQDIILISDGDDPADDREWAKGADVARRAKTPVFTVGVGDPVQESLIAVDGAYLEAPPRPGEPPDPVRTRLHEDVLRDIAAETRGEYLAARRETPPLGEFFRTRIEPFPSREVSDDRVPQLQEHYAWFFAPALLLFAVSWFRGR